MGMMDGNTGVAASCSPDPCHWVTHMKGGQPLSVSRCSLCGSINWALLAEDFEKDARARACEIMEGTYGRHDYPDGSKSLCTRGMVNVIQVYSLFSKEPGQDGCDLPKRPTSNLAHGLKGDCTDLDCPEHYNHAQ